MSSTITVESKPTNKQTNKQKLIHLVFVSFTSTAISISITHLFSWLSSRLSFPETSLTDSNHQSWLLFLFLLLLLYIIATTTTLRHHFQIHNNFFLLRKAFFVLAGLSPPDLKNPWNLIKIRYFFLFSHWFGTFILLFFSELLSLNCGRFYLLFMNYMIPSGTLIFI